MITMKDLIEFMQNFRGQPISFYKGGMIKKENRGKFTKQAKKHGMSVQKYADHVLSNKDRYSTTLVKRAVFAKNAKKWKHQDGGVLNFDYIKNKFKESNANFVQRIISGKPLRTIKDWENPENVISHKLSYAIIDDDKVVVYPNVTESNGRLYDFTNPKYKHGKWDALNYAILKGDTLVVNSPKHAEYLTTNYKKVFDEIFN